MKLFDFQPNSFVWGFSGEWYYYGNNQDTRNWSYVIYLGPVRFWWITGKMEIIEDNKWMDEKEFLNLR